jgi:acyl carrier protein
VQQDKVPPVARDDDRTLDQRLRALLANGLGLAPARVAEFDGKTELFGALPELDSMAVAALLTAIEEEFGVLIEDDDVEVEDFTSYGALSSFVDRLNARD